MNSISLSELQQLVKRGIDSAHPLPYWVVAEVSEMKVNYSGHCYLELVEKGGANHVPKAKVRAVIWQNSYQMLSAYFTQATGQPLQAGLQVLVKVSISYHELYGLSLVVMDIDPAYTLGDLERQRQLTIAQLQQEGIYEMNRELEFPLVPQRLAVISSANAAGYQDFINELTRAIYRFEVTLFDAFMQGAGAENSILAALDQILAREEEFDAVVVIRGGGSQSDLGCFNSYLLCSHLAQFPLPIVTGIGHDKDQSVADLVAAVALKTPTAVAGYLLESVADFDAHLDEALLELREGLSRLTLTHAARLKELESALQRSAEKVLQQRLQYLSSLPMLMRERVKHYFVTQTKELSLLGELVQSHDPQQILRRGFAVVRSAGKSLLSTKEVAVGEMICIELYDGGIEATITDKR